MVKKGKLPLAAMENLLKEAGIERVSEQSKVALQEVLQDEADRLAQKATVYSSHAGRKTIKKEDILLSGTS